MALGRIFIANGPQFDFALKEWGEETVPRLHREATIKSVNFILRSLINKTPVGDPSLWAASSLPPPPGYKPGRARAGWQVGLGTTTEGDTTENLRDPGGSTTLGKGIRKARRMRPFQTVFIYNNVPYIGRLEDGWSSQAPPGGIVQLTLAEFAALGRV